MSTQSALVGAACEESARRDLLAFARATYPGFTAPPHVVYLAELLERAAAGDVPRLAISCPPGHGKSVLLQCFVAWFIGRQPGRRVLTISASESLAKRNSRDSQALVRSDAWPWPDVGFANDSVLEWSLGNASEVRAIGKSGTISGFRADGIVGDDIQNDAGSDATRQSDWEWFRSVLTTRLEPSAWCCLIQTRWNDADILGQLADSESADQWTFVNLPALALEDDILGRSPNEPLWPARWPIEKLNAKRSEVGSGVFASLYQGDPVPSGGATFAPEWFEHRYDALPKQLAEPDPINARTYLEQVINRRTGYAQPSPPIVIQSCDSAWKTGLTNDRSAIATLVSDGRDIFIADLWFGRLAFPDLRRTMEEVFCKHRPSRLYVEEAASGFALVEDLKRTTPIPIIGVPPGRESKEARAESVTGLFESGRVKFPRSASWMNELLREFLRFPYGRHDDIVDSIVLGIRQLQKMMAQVAATAQMQQRFGRFPGGSWMSR